MAGTQSGVLHQFLDEVPASSPCRLQVIRGDNDDDDDGKHGEHDEADMVSLARENTEAPTGQPNDFNLVVDFFFSISSIGSTTCFLPCPIAPTLNASPASQK